MTAVRVTIKQTLQCDAKTYWKLFFSQPFLDAYWAELGWTEGQAEQDGKPPKATTRSSSWVSPVDAPGPVKKIFGSTQHVSDSGAYDPAASTYTFTVRPGTMPDKVKIGGVVTVTDNGDGTSARVNEVDVSVKIFGLGRLVEGTIEKETRAGDAALERVINRLAAK